MFRQGWRILYLGACVVASSGASSDFCVVIVSGEPRSLVTYRQVEPLIKEKCASCHRGPYLDLTRFPFFTDRYPDQVSLVKEFLVRAELKDPLKRMPPANFPALTEAEINLLKRWLGDGLLAD